MVSVATVKDLDVEVTPQVICDGPEEFFEQCEREVLSVRSTSRCTEVEIGTVTEIDHCTGERLVHREVGMTVAADPSLVADGFSDGITENNSGVFDGVVEVHFDITVHFDFEIDQAVLRKQGEHVVEEGNLRLDRRLPRTVQV